MSEGAASYGYPVYLVNLKGRYVCCSLHLVVPSTERHSLNSRCSWCHVAVIRWDTTTDSCLPMRSRRSTTSCCTRSYHHRLRSPLSRSCKRVLIGRYRAHCACSVLAHMPAPHPVAWFDSGTTTCPLSFQRSTSRSCRALLSVSISFDKSHLRLYQWDMLMTCLACFCFPFAGWCRCCWQSRIGPYGYTVGMTPPHCILSVPGLMTLASVLLATVFHANITT